MIGPAIICFSTAMLPTWLLQELIQLVGRLCIIERL
jgi:hypothetical protein